MSRLLAKIIYFLIGISMVAVTIHIAWLRESIELVITPGALFIALAILLSYYIIGCNLWEEKSNQEYFYTDRWQKMEQEAQADIDSGRIFRYPNMDKAIKSLKDNDDI